MLLCSALASAAVRCCAAVLLCRWLPDCGHSGAPTSPLRSSRSVGPQPQTRTTINAVLSTHTEAKPRRRVGLRPRCRVGSPVTTQRLICGGSEGSTESQRTLSTLNRPRSHCGTTVPSAAAPLCRSPCRWASPVRLLVCPLPLPLRSSAMPVQLVVVGTLETLAPALVRLQRSTQAR